jgi:Transglycosylase-like domain
MLKRFIPLVIAGPLILIGSGCSPEQTAAWLGWNAQDPAAAQDWARNECGALCTDDWDHDGVVEPEGDDGSDGPQMQQYAAQQAPSSRWDRIAQCESGGNWSYPLVTNRTGTYSGGLMIWTKAWAAYGGHEFAPNAYQASKAQQIVVAERILADNGWGAWDCA